MNRKYLLTLESDYLIDHQLIIPVNVVVLLHLHCRYLNRIHNLDLYEPNMEGQNRQHAQDCSYLLKFYYC